ncbi:MAG TPA: class I SAM-dependent methyltransferase [Beutenbergiaceae bacterium]|nr:class I SAM-dependent methyltransferase [Beutenbergiaceae bacterium]
MSIDRFDTKASTWDADPEKVARANAIAAGIAEAVPLSQNMQALEYGAGTGLVSQALQHQIGPLTLADPSAGMREMLQEKIAAGVLRLARVWDLNLETDPLPPETFELILTSMVLHHIRDLPTVLTGFADLLEPGGYLCIADLDKEDGSFHDYDFDGHRGFDRAELTADLQAAGFSQVTIKDCTYAERDGHRYSVFLAVAQR